MPTHEMELSWESLVKLPLAEEENKLLFINPSMVGFWEDAGTVLPRHAE